MKKTCRSINWWFSLQSHKQGGLALAETQQELGTLSLMSLSFGSPLLVSPAAWDGGRGPPACLGPSSPCS